MTDNHLVQALAFAQQHAPSVIVVDTLLAMDIVTNHLSRNGRVFTLRASSSGPSRADIIKDFNDCDYQNSYLVVTKQLAQLGSIRVTREASMVATGVMREARARQCKSIMQKSTGLKIFMKTREIDRHASLLCDSREASKTAHSDPPQSATGGSDRQSLAVMGGDQNEWYFDSDGHYIDVQRYQDGSYSVFFFNRKDNSTGWWDQNEHLEPGHIPMTLDEMENIIAGLLLSHPTHVDHMKGEQAHLIYQSGWRDLGIAALKQIRGRLKERE